MQSSMASGSLVAVAMSSAAVTSGPSACPATLPRNRTVIWRRSRLSCRASLSPGDLRLDRRDVLAGFAAATAGGLGAHPSLARADEAAPCLLGNKVTAGQLTCQQQQSEFEKPCPQKSTTIVDFKAAPPGAPVRARLPAHTDDRDLMEKYQAAVGKMKELPASDPRSFQSQSNIHQAYCDGYYQYDPTKAAGQPFDVHYSWIFAPWHRMYIYFYERILGSLIGDDTFALPYWNWDAVAGMSLPAAFRDPYYTPSSSNNPGGGRRLVNPLYNANRNAAHLNTYVALDSGRDDDLNIRFDPKALGMSNDVVQDNLATLYDQMVRQGKGARCFHGDKLCVEADATGTMGTLERLAHSGVHVWVGNKQSCVVGHDAATHCGADMGFLGTAGRDPVFYSHHANVDRMWHLWTAMGNKDFTDANWLDTSFVFYDEKPQLVRIRVRDVLDIANLGYRYENPEPQPWRSFKPTLGRREALSQRGKPASSLVFPLVLTVGKNVTVPAVARPPGPKGKGKVEALLFDGIELNPQGYTRFDVAVNLDPVKAGAVGPRWIQFAGSFISLPRAATKTTAVTKLELPLDDVLADLGVAEGEAVDVVLVPRTPGVTIRSPPRIELTDC